MALMAKICRCEPRSRAHSLCHSISRWKGASRSQVLAAQRAEFVALGLLAGPLLGVVCVAVNVIAGARAALNQPPPIALREV